MSKRKKKILVGWVEKRLELRSQFVNIRLIVCDKLEYPITKEMRKIRLTIEELK
jgi:hypothetical protein